MKVYIVVVSGKNPRIYGVYMNEQEAENEAYLLSKTNGEWCNVVEKEVF